MSDAPIIPNFGDDEESDRKIAFICSKGNLDMAYPALILANAALGEGVECHIFFTFWGFDMIMKSRMNDLKFTPAGNTAMHMPVGDVRIPQALAPLPGMQPMATKMLKKQIADLGVPEVPDFLDQIVGGGRPPVGLPVVRRHEQGRRERPARRPRGHHQRLGLHRDDRRRPGDLHLSDPRARRRRPGPGRRRRCARLNPALAP